MNLQKKCSILGVIKKHSVKAASVSIGISIGGGLLYSKVRDEIGSLPIALNEADNLENVLLSDLTVQTLYSVMIFGVGIILYFVARHYYDKNGCEKI